MRFVAQKRPKASSTCPTKDSDSTTHSPSVLDVVIPAWLLLPKTGCKALPYTNYSQKHPPMVPLILQMLQRKWPDQFFERYNFAIYYHEMRKINQNHCASVVAGVNKGVWALGWGAALKNSRQSPPSATYMWRPHVTPGTHLGRRMETTQSASTLGDLQASRKRQ